MRKAIALIMVFLCLACIAPVNAVGSSEQEVRNAINDVLYYMEPQKADYGLGSINFDSLMIGSEITVYEYKNNSFVATDYALYPLLNSSGIAAIAILRQDGTGVLRAQIDVDLANQINETKQDNERFAIVYDKDSCYYVTQSGIIKLFSLKEVVASRSKLNPYLRSMPQQQDLNLSAAESKLALQYGKSSVQKPRLGGTLLLSVPKITQSSTSKYCWACSVASIGNYLTNYNYTGIYVAMNEYGSDYNKGASISVALDNLSEIYGITYLSTGGFNSGIIYENLSNGYPLFAECSVSGGGGHAVVVCGENPISGYITIMDPNSSSYVSVYSTSANVYSYVSTSFGTTVTLTVLGRKYP